ncbi:site-2 protease family protein [Candidatus Woesearchaeota archaeon]|nr:site-2 protease family protein [Candidatus Woesearchaeota archaeon]
MSFLSVIIQYKWVILFYLIIILIIVRNKKKFEFQAKFIALYRTKVGLRLIEKIGTKYAKFIKILGYIGIFVGYLGMAIIMIFLIKGLYDLVFVPEAPAVIAPVIPGVPIPGSPIFVPFWYGIISLFIVVLIHEFSHGIVAKAYKLPVLNTGIVFFGPLIGAFVEPDEKKLKKREDKVRYSVFAAGPFSNIITAGIVLLILSLVLTPVTDAVAQPIGFSFSEVEQGMPAELAGIEPGVVYNKVNNQSVLSIPAFLSALENLKINETVIISNEQNTYIMMAAPSKEEPGKAVIGVRFSAKKNTHFTNQDNVLVQLLLWFDGLFIWIFILSLGLGLANLLPLGPVDGGRMLQVSLTRSLGKKKGNLVWSKVTIIMIIILAILLLTPIIKAVLPI